MVHLEIITNYLYQAVTDAHGENNCKLDIDFCCALLYLLYESGNKQRILDLFKKLLTEDWGINKQNDTPDSILNYWCARTDEGLMFEIAREIYSYEG